MKLSEIFTFENLYEAHKNCRKSKQQKGEVIRFETNLSYNLHNIRKGLKKGEFTEIQIEERPCVLISKHNILCNKTLLECVWEHDDILFIKMKKNG